MAIKPILFNTEMVKAIMEGRKTQTRRVCKGQPQGCITPPDVMGYEPPFHIDDILWVRETWNYGYVESSDAEGSDESWFEELRKPATGYLGALSRYFYLADKVDEQIMDEIGGKWRPSIHMPKEAARIFLRVKAVRVERLQDMKAQDSLDEGVKLHLYGIVNGADPLLPFAELWNSTINKRDFSKYCWSANPWVWVIEFERTEAKPWE